MDEISVASTVLSEVDGARGRLIVRGHDVESLAAHSTFEDVAALLWQDLVPAPLSAADVRAQLGAQRVEAYTRLLPLLTSMDLVAEDAVARALRVGLAAGDSNDPCAVAAIIPVAIATAWNLHCGRDPVPPEARRGHAEDFLRMLRSNDPLAGNLLAGNTLAEDAITGTPAAGNPTVVSPRDEEVRALNSYLVTVAEHGMNASTFTARVVASTGAGLSGAVTAAFCALQGPLHGGAPGPVLDMLDAIGDANNIDAWLTDKLKAGERLMGFGHRIYRVRDPRADVLKSAVSALRQTNDSQRLRFAEAVERGALDALARHKPNHPLQTNVEFYTALLLEAVGLPRALFTPVFAMGRVAGWIGHVYEQRKTGRLIRPQSDYIGPRP